MTTGDQWTHSPDDYSAGSLALLAFADALDERATSVSALSTEIPTNASDYQSTYDSGATHIAANTSQSAKAAEYAARLKHAARLARFYSGLITKQSSDQDETVDESTKKAEGIDTDVDPTTKPKTTTVSDTQPKPQPTSGDDRTEI